MKKIVNFNMVKKHVIIMNVVVMIVVVIVAVINALDKSSCYKHR